MQVYLREQQPSTRTEDGRSAQKKSDGRQQDPQRRARDQPADPGDLVQPIRCGFKARPHATGTLQEQPDGIRRKGLILASLMKFKQLCNHPDQYLGQGQFTEIDSGKFQRLRPICETIFEKRERVLIFTQFKEMTDPLKRYLETVFEHEGLVLHGGTPVRKRRQMIEQFQGDHYTPFMVLSLKAGGVGLNLTAANHVVHFDRWWNPAVEDQATDRAFRIGQQKNVVVHKFVTKGTVEEKIDRMLADKAELSRQIIPSSGEAWITEMDDKELVKLFTLSL